MIRTPRLALRRVTQTLTAFDNGPRVLWDLAAGKTPFAPDALTFRMHDGTVMRCPNVPGARVPVYELFAEDAYRFEPLAGRLPADFTALDIGGQVGCFSVALAKRFPQCRVFTFEASPATAGWLRENVATNGLGERVTVTAKAVSDHAGTLEFADNGKGSGLNGLTAPDGSGVISVDCVTFADAVAAAGSEVDLVKIDTEGAEYAIVLASETADWATVRSVVLEHHPVPGRSWTELRDFLTGAGFVIDRHEVADHELGTLWFSRAA
jgi:FkbM family methyltransferase